MADNDGFLESVRQLRRVLLSPSHHEYAIWFHCKPPKPQPEDRDALTGGYSGADLIRRALFNLTEAKEDELDPKNNTDAAATPQDLQKNLYLLDAPIQRGRETGVD